MQAAARPAVREIDVCVCTFRRASVSDLIASLAKQVLPANTRIRVVVVDNDETPSARDAVETSLREHGLAGVYLHAPARNISVARNACLGEVEGEAVAFVDDDEVARPGWLGGLLAEMDRAGAEVVFGRVCAVYAEDAPRWMRAADLHSTPPPVRNGRIEGGYTCNVLMRRAAVGGLRFDPAFGRSGGEDTAFFAALQARGARMAYAEDAVVDEPVTAARANLAWLSRRAFRSGQSWGLVRFSRKELRVAVIAESAAKIAWSWAAAAVMLWSPAGWRRHAVRAQFHAGVLAAALGRAPVDIYGGARG